MDRGAWQATIHGVTKIWHNWTTSTFFFSLLIKLEHIPGHSTFLTFVEGNDDYVVISTEKSFILYRDELQNWSF